MLCHLKILARLCDMRQDETFSAAVIEARLAKTRGAKSHSGNARWKGAEIEVLKVICKRMCLNAPMSDTLVWLAHGSPARAKVRC